MPGQPGHGISAPGGSLVGLIPAATAPSTQTGGPAASAAGSAAGQGSDDFVPPTTGSGGLIGLSDGKGSVFPNVLFLLLFAITAGALRLRYAVQR